MTALLLILGLAALVAGQVLTSAYHWSPLPPDTIQTITATSCSLIPICDLTLRYPPYFGIVLVLILGSMLVLALAFRHSALTTRVIDVPTAAQENTPRAWNWLTLVIAVLAAIATVLIVVTAVNSPDRFPAPPAWAAAIALWAITFYQSDRLRRAMPIITRREFALFVAYAVLVIALGFVYHLPMLHEDVPRVIFVLIASVVALVLWRVRLISGVAAVFVIVAVAGLAAFTYNLDTWHYAFIGDEYAFYQHASAVLANPGGYNILDPSGVYESHPVFASYIQAVSLWLYGGDIYSWRINGALMVMLSAPAIYMLVRELKSRNAGLIAVVIYVSSHHFLGISHPGYFLMMLLPVVSTTMALAVLSLERRSLFGIFLCGVAASFTFYTYTLAIPLIPLPMVLLCLWVIWPNRALPFVRRLITALLIGVIFTLAVLVTSSPRILNTDWLRDAEANTLLSHSEIPGMTNPLLQQVIPNMGYTLGATLYFDVNSHYVSGQNLDPLSDVLAILGIAGLIAVIARRRTALWLLIGFFAVIAVIGGTTPYPYPPHSRTFLLLIFYAVFGGLGASYLWDTVRDIGLHFSPAILSIGAAVVALAVVGLNLYQFFALAPKDIPQTLIAMIVREMQVDPPSTTVYYTAKIPNDDNMLMVLNDFHVDMTRFQPIMERDAQTALTQIKQDAHTPYRVIIEPDLDDPQAWFDEAKQLWPDHPVELFKDENGTPQYDVIDVPN